MPDCSLGKDSGKYVTSPLESQEAMQMLNLHLQFNHSQQGGDHQDPRGGGARTKVEKVPRPTLGKGLSEDKFVHFESLYEIVFINYLQNTDVLGLIGSHRNLFNIIYL